MNQTPVTLLHRAVEFLGLPVAEEVAGSSVAFDSLAKMESMERFGALSSSDGRFGVGAPGNEESFKVRQREIDGFANYLSEEHAANCYDSIRSNLDPAYGCGCRTHEQQQ